MISKPLFNALVFLSLVVALGLGVMNLQFGDLNQDEGWYLNSARLVADGKLPYRDFAFTQAPVLPFAYALFAPVIESHGVGGGRAVTLAFGLFAALAAAGLAGRLVQPALAAPARLLAFMLAALNVYQSYFTVVVKTYSLCALLLAVSLLLLHMALNRRNLLLVFVAAFAMTLAGGTRISAGAAVAVSGFWLLACRRRLGDATWMAFGVGAVAAAGLLFGPWLMMAPEGFLFGVVEYHSARTAGGVMQALVYKAGFLSRVVQAYYLAILLGVAAFGAARWWPKNNASEDPTPDFRWLLAWVVAGVSLVHLAAPFPYDDYQAVLFPAFTALVAAGVLGLLGNRLRADALPRAVAVILVTVFLAACASSASSPLNQDWMIRGRDRIWWRMKDQPALNQLKAVADDVRALAPAGSTVLTMDLYLAVQAGMKVPPGLEMGPFSYYPDYANERASTLHVVNADSLRELLSHADAPVAALSGYAFAIDSPGITETRADVRAEFEALVAERYDLMKEVPYFGQGATTLRLFKRKEAP